MSAISPSGKEVLGVVSYPIKLSVDANPDLGLIDGMTAVADIITEHKDNVLIVPYRAVSVKGEREAVQVMIDGKPQQRAVHTGISNLEWTEIIDGLAESEEVLVPAPPSRAPMPLMPGM